MPEEFAIVSPEDIATGRLLPPEMLRDLRAVATAEMDAIQGLSQALRQETHILSDDRLEEAVKDFFEDDAVGQAVTRALQNVRSESKQMLLALVDRWRKAKAERREFLSDEDFAALQQNLDLLVQDYPSLTLMQKAQRLLRDTGNEIDDTLIICDLRPVFDEPRERVEGFVAIANLRIRYIRQNGDRDVFEIALTQEELSVLVEQGQKAIRKLEVLKETVHDLV